MKALGVHLMFQGKSRFHFRFGKPEEIKTLPTLREVSAEHLAEARAAARNSFNAVELQVYRDLLTATPLDNLLDELEKIQRQYGQEPPRPE